MGKHKKSTPNHRPTPDNISSKKSSIDQKNEEEKKIDRITSVLVDLCGQKSGNQPLTANALWKEHLEIRGKVNELRELQRSAVDASSPKQEPNRGERLATMVDWCNRNGLRAPGVSIFGFEEQGETNFGLRAEKNFEPGELVVSVSRRLFLSSENGLQRNGELRSLFSSDPLLSGMPNVALSFLVAVEKVKRADSFWYPYLDSLPSNYETPLTFLIDGNEKLAEALRGSVAFEETLKLYKNIVRQYAYFYQMISSMSPAFSILTSSKLLPAKNFVFDLYLWAAVTVMTRINFVPSAASGGKRPDEKRNGEMVPALIPFFDMANHGDVSPCTDFVDEDKDNGRQSAVIYASKPYQPQSQLLIFYGERKFWEFFVYNGFVYDDCRRYPNVVVKLGLSSSDRLLALKDKALQRFGMLPSEQFVVSKYALDESGAPFPISMQRFATIFCSNEEELESFCQSESEAVQYQWRTETTEAARRFLLMRLSLLLRSYAAVNDETETTSVSPESSVDERRMGSIRRLVRGEVDSLKSAAAFLEQQRQ